MNRVRSIGNFSFGDVVEIKFGRIPNLLLSCNIPSQFTMLPVCGSDGDDREHHEELQKQVEDLTHLSLYLYSPIIEKKYEVETDVCLLIYVGFELIK